MGKTETVGCFAKLVMRMLSEDFGGDRQLLTAFFHKFQLVREYVAIKISGKPAQLSIGIPKNFQQHAIAEWIVWVQLPDVRQTMKHSFWIVSNMSEIINLNVGLFGVLGRDDRARERWNMIKNAHNNSIMTAEHTHSNSVY